MTKGNGVNFELDVLLHPAQAFNHPFEVVNDPDLTLNEKRAILASGPLTRARSKLRRSCERGLRLRSASTTSCKRCDSSIGRRTGLAIGIRLDCVRGAARQAMITIKAACYSRCPATGFCNRCGVGREGNVVHVDFGRTRDRPGSR
jgi:hypothetical protein